MKSVDSLPRDEMLSKLKRYIEISSKDTAILAVDMHRGHLDPSIATMPVPAGECKRVIASTKRLIAIGRSFEVPIIHVVLQYRSKPFIGAESTRNPWWQAVAETQSSLTPGASSTVVHHNVEGSPQTEIIREIAPTKDEFVIRTKKRLSAFYGTDLDILLRTLRIETLVIVGINTNTCVLNTCFDAFNRDFKVFVISDCVASMYGRDLHYFALQNISRCLGWVLTVDEFEEKLRDHSKSFALPRLEKPRSLHVARKRGRVGNGSWLSRGAGKSA